MLLAIDIGNTQTVLGLFEGPQLVHTWRLSSDATRTTDELRAFVVHLFHEADRTVNTVSSSLELVIDQIIIASVVPALTHTWTELASDLSYINLNNNNRKRGNNAAPGNAPIIVNSAVAKDFSAHIDNPAEVGADRIANAVAARELYGAPAIVIDFGTATNIDIIDADGNYIGGVISPGLQTSANALFETAARLPVIDLELPANVLGTTTKTAVQSGLLYGEAGKVDSLLRALKAEQPTLNVPQLPVIATGGLASLLVPLINQITHSDEHLTLRGLQLIAQLSTAEVLDAAPARVCTEGEGVHV